MKPLYKKALYSSAFFSMYNGDLEVIIRDYCHYKYNYDFICPVKFQQAEINVLYCFRNRDLEILIRSYFYSEFNYIFESDIIFERLVNPLYFIKKYLSNSSLANHGGKILSEGCHQTSFYINSGINQEYIYNSNLNVYKYLNISFFIGFFFVIIGLFFKLGVAPFHM